MFKQNFKLSIGIMLVYFLLFSMIDKGYRDDYYRMIEGNFAWDTDGRPLAYLLVYIINSGGILTDISPRSYIISAIVASICCAIIGFKVLKSTPAINLISASLIFFSPFFLQNMSYKFDVVIMCTSILLCCLPYLYDDKNKYFVFLISAGCLIASLSTYQASIPLFLMLNVLTLISQRFNKEACINSLIRIISFAFSIIFYTIAIARPLIANDNAKHHSEILLPVNHDAANLFIKNIKDLFDVLGLIYNENNILIFLPAICIASFCLFRMLSKEKPSKLWVASFIITSLSALLSCFIFFITKYPSYEVRSMIGFGSLTFFITSISVILIKKNNWAAYIACIPPLLFFTSISNDYIVAAKSQFKYEKQIIELIYSDYKKLDGKGEIQIFGHFPFTKQAKTAFSKQPILKTFMRPDIPWWSGKFFFYTEYPLSGNIPIITDWRFSRAYKLTCDKKAIGYNGIYTTFKEDKNIVFVFTNKC